MCELTTRIDTTAHKGAQRLFVAGLSVGAIYWGAVIRWSESFLLCYVGMALIGSVLHGCRMGCYGTCKSTLRFIALESFIHNTVPCIDLRIPLCIHSIFQTLSADSPSQPANSPDTPPPPAPIPSLPGLNTNNR